MKKLIEEYQLKIKSSDDLIETIMFEIKLIRRGGTSVMNTEEWINLKKVANAQRQCYVQFTKDLEDYV